MHTSTEARHDPPIPGGGMPVHGDDIADLIEINGGTQITVICEDDPDQQPVTIRVKQRGWNGDGVLTVYGRRLGDDRDAHWHLNPTTERWRSGKPCRPACVA